MSSLPKAGALAVAGFAFLFAVAPTGSQERKGVISHPPLLKMVLPNTANQEVAVYEAEYEPGGMNPRHLHHPPSHHSITSSAATSTLSGTVRPSILAVEALMTSSNFDD